MDGINQPSLPDMAFEAMHDELHQAINLIARHATLGTMADCVPLPEDLPTQGLGDQAALSALAPHVLGGAHRLDDPLSFAHMDPPTPWVTWATTMWNARLNQNLLHPMTAPVARNIEARVVSWLAPFFGMDGGHMLPGSTVANLTAIWAARELRGITEVAAPDTAHVSIEKCANLLGLKYRRLPTDRVGRLVPDTVGDLEQSCLVLVAGATSTGVVDPLHLAGKAAWTHIDAAWAGPLRLSARHKHCLSGIEHADSVTVSAHKWLFQPKESALVFFRDTERAHSALSFGGAYLAASNIGLLGSHGAVAVPLLATLWAWGEEGIAARIDRCMAAAATFAAYVDSEPALELLAAPETGVVVWRALETAVDDVVAAVPLGMVSQTVIAGKPWLRCVAANPNVDVSRVIATVEAAIARLR